MGGLCHRDAGGWFWGADSRAEMGAWLFVMTQTLGARRASGDHHQGHASTSADWERGLGRGCELLKWSSISSGAGTRTLVPRVPPKSLDPVTILKSTNFQPLSSISHPPMGSMLWTLSAWLNIWLLRLFEMVKNSSGLPLTISMEHRKYLFGAIFTRGFVVRWLSSSTTKFTLSI